MKKAFAAAVVAAIGMVAAAADNEPDVLVTADRTTRSSAQTPANVTVITAEDLSRQAYDTVVEALNGACGITVRSTSGNPVQSEISMRGFGENSHGRVLVLLDGRKLNRPDMAGINWLEIPLSGVDRIEIVRGAGSALYGDHAVGGVVNIITKKGGKEPALDASVSFSSFATDHERIALSGSSGDFTYALDGNRLVSEGYRDRSAIESIAAGARLGYDITDSLSAALSVSYDSTDFQLPGYLTLEQAAENPRQSAFPADEGADRHLNAALEVQTDFGRRGRASVSFCFDRKNSRTDITSWYSYSDADITSFGILPRYSLETKLFNRDNKLVLGADYYDDGLDISRYADAARSAATCSAGVSKRTLGFYASDAFHVTPSWILDAGCRFEQARVSGEMSSAGSTLFDDAKTHNENAANVAITRTFGRHSKVFARFGTIFRYPFLDEQVSYYGFGTDQLYADMEAETGDNTEIGAEIGITDSLRAGLTLFLLRMRNEIAYNPETWRNENMDDSARRGVEATLKCVLAEGLSAEANYSFTDASFASGAHDGKELPLVPRSSASVGLLAELPFGFILAPAARYVGETWLGGDYDNAYEKLPAYVVADVALHYKPAAVKGLDAFVAVANVLNEQYFSAGFAGWDANGYYPAPGRSYKFGLSYGF